jgi:glucose/arabinose dehydrogenase
LPRILVRLKLGFVITTPLKTAKLDNDSRNDLAPIASSRAVQRSRGSDHLSASTITERYRDFGQSWRKVKASAMSRRRPAIAIFLLFAAFAARTAQAQITLTDPGFVNEKVIGGFTVPMGFAFAPDGRIFVWEKAGKVKIVKNGQVLATPFLDISANVNHATDRGLVGLALDPDFSSNGYVYLGYVYENGGDPASSSVRTERVTRVQADPADPDRVLAGSETILLGTKATTPCNSGEDCMINEAGTHTIDNLAFGSDGKLWISNGEGSDYRSATAGSLRTEDLNSLSGKLIRINRDGTAPSDNPWYDGSNSVKSKIWSYGLRNPFRFSFGPSGIDPYIGDVGWTAYEEINNGKAKNFGWPCYEGAGPQPQFQSAFTECANLAAGSVAAPLYTYAHVPGVGGCIIMGPYLQGSSFPANYQNNLFFSDYSNSWMKRAVFDSTGQITSVITFATNVNNAVYMIQGPEGDLYWVSISAGSIYRIRYTGTANRAPVANATATPTSGLSPLTVTFSSAGSTDPDGETVSYLWNFGDGQSSTTPNPVHQYTASGVQKFVATLTVKDPEAASSQAFVTITVGNNAPTAAISKPANGLVVAPGSTIQFSGSGTDTEDGLLPGSALTWQVILHHNTHTHLITTITGSSGSFVAILPDTIDTYSYELLLTATDTGGLTGSKSIRIDMTGVASGCTLKTTSPSITICSPAAGATVFSPVHIVAGTTNSSGVLAMAAYIDSVLVYKANVSAINQNLAVGAGTHNLTIQSWDNAGHIIKESVQFVVSSTGACTANATDPSITICNPQNNETVLSPVHIAALTTNSAGITGMKVYVDSVGVYTTTANKIDTSLAVSAGAHKLTVQSWDKAGRVTIESQQITVTGSGSCAASTTDPSITICSPENNATVSSPVHIVALTTNSAGITGMKIYVDSAGVYTTTANKIDTSLVMSAGTHKLTVQSWDQAGRVIIKAININISP